jgi:hypothetical protein
MGTLRVRCGAIRVSQIYGEGYSSAQIAQASIRESPLKSRLPGLHADVGDRSAGHLARPHGDPNERAHGIRRCASVMRLKNI